MIFANGGVQDRGYERKCEEVVRSQNQWDFQIRPSIVPCFQASPLELDLVDRCTNSGGTQRQIL